MRDLLPFLRHLDVDASVLPKAPDIPASEHQRLIDERAQDGGHRCRLCEAFAWTAVIVQTEDGPRWLDMCPPHFLVVMTATADDEADALPAESQVLPPAGESTEVDAERSFCSICSEPMERPFAIMFAEWPVGPEEQRPCSPACAKEALEQWNSWLDDPGPRGYGPEWPPPARR